MAEPTADERKAFAKSGVSLPDGSYYVRDANDLSNAIEAVGRGEAAGDDGAAIRRHIMKRAEVLKLSARIPDTWMPDGMLKHDDVDAFLAHHGIKGMRWGHRKGASSSDSGSTRVGGARRVVIKSPDATRARETAETIRQHKTTDAVSNEDLQHLVRRLNLEKQFSQLSEESASAGKKALDDALSIGGNAAKNTAQNLATKGLTKGIEVGAPIAGRAGKKLVKKAAGNIATQLLGY